MADWDPPAGFDLSAPPQGAAAAPPAAPAEQPAWQPPAGFTLDAPPEAKPAPGFLSTVLGAGIRGAVEGGTAALQAPTAFRDRPQPPEEQDTVSRVLSTPISEGWSSPTWWAAHIVHGAAASVPGLALGAAGALAGEAVAPEAGPVAPLAGGAAGFSLGSMIQEIAPAYQRARVDGLDHDAAVNRALADTGIAGAFGAVMGLAPGMSAFGREAEGALRRPISEALLQIFGVQPGIGTAQRVAEGAVEGKMPTAAELGTGYAENVGLGVALTGGHAALAGARAVGAARPPSDVAAVLDAGSVDEAAAHAANVAGTPGAVPAVPAEAVEPEPAAAAPAQETPAPLAIDADATARAQGFADAADMAATQRAGASVGAASSRDIPATAALADQLTPAQKATALQKMVLQTVYDRMSPQGRDDATYVPDVTRPEAMKDFGPAAPGEPMSASAEHKVLYNTDPDYKERFDAVVRENNGVMTHDLIDGLIGDANSRKAAMDEADKLMPGPVGLFHDQRPVDAQPIVDEINDILNGPKGKLDAVKTTLGRVLASLYDKNGQLETLPSMLKGVRDNINHKLYDNTPSDEGAAARNSRDQLKAVQSVVDGVISEGVPGTKYQDYLKNLSAALGQVDKLDFLQKYLTGPKQLTGPDGLLQLNKVQQMLKDIEAHHDDETGGAKQLTMPEINRIEAVRNELQAKDLLDRRMKVPGSPTVQIASGAGILGSGPLGMGIKRAGEAALHLGLFKTTGGLGNAALVGYRYGIQPAMEARSAARAAAEMAARKERLLDTTPRVTEAGEPIPLPALPPRPPPQPPGVGTVGMPEFSPRPGGAVGTLERAADGSYVARAPTGDATPIRTYDPGGEPRGGGAAGTVPRETMAAIRDLNAKAGINTVFYADHPDLPFDGFHDPARPNTVFVSDNPQRAVAQVAAHEVAHALSDTRLPDGTNLGDRLVRQITEGVTPAGQAHAEATFGGTAPKREAFPTGLEGDAAHAASVQAHLMTELAADISGEAPKFKTFLPRVIDAIQARFGASVAGKVLGKLVEGLSKALNTVRGLFGAGDTVSQRWVTNLADIHDTVAQMYAERFGSPVEREQARLKAMKAQARADSAQRAGVTFASPRLEEGQQFREAVGSLVGPRHEMFRAASRDIASGLGIEAKEISAVGVWLDGAEGSLITESNGVSWDQLRTQAAMQGALGQQKATLVFQEHPDGGGAMYSFPAIGSLATIRRQLLADGVAFHSLAPTKNGAIVYAVDTDGSMADAVERAAARYGDAKPTAQRGRADFISGDSKPGATDSEQREDARRSFVRVIEGSRVPGAAELWERIRSSYGSALQIEPGAAPAARAQLERNLTAIPIFDQRFPEMQPRNVEVVAKDLMDRGQAALRMLGIRDGKISGPAPATDALLSRSIAAEVKDAIRRAQGTNKSALDWYTHSVAEAVATASLVHPEIATDPNMRMGFTAALAVTSQGEMVSSNVRLAMPAYEYFEKNGRFPTDIKAKEATSMNGNFEKLNEIIDKRGFPGLREFLATESTVRELEEAGQKIGGENKETRVYGSAILGPKIGQGFFQNLNGNYKPVTMDLWFMRAWGRLTGTLVGYSPEVQAAQATRLRQALEDAGRPVPTTAEGLAQTAKDIVGTHERHFAANRLDYTTTKEFAKSELTLAAERYVHGQEGINEAPTGGGQRNWMRSVVQGALDVLAKEGIKLTPADLQAVWWYPEKELYEKLGSGDTDATNVNYSTALQDYAKDKGKSDEEIARAVGSVDRRSGPTPEATVQGGTEGVRPEGVGPHGPEEARGAETPKESEMKPDSPEFKEWYRGSIYVDSKGQPVLMYHGTTKEFSEFRPTLTLDDHVPGISVTPSKAEAATYGTPRPVYVRATNPIDYRQLDDWAAARAGKTGDPEFSAFDVSPHTLVNWLKDAGYDAIDYTADPLSGYGIRVFDAAQIRRAARGTARQGLINQEMKLAAD